MKRIATRAAWPGSRHSLMLIATAVISIAWGLTAHAASAGQRYGLIEIGAKGVKAYSFDLDRVIHDATCSQGGEENDAYLKCLDPQTLESKNVNPISDSDFQDTTKAVEQLASDLGAKGIAADHLYTVISSSMAKDEVRADQLVGRLKSDKALGLKHPIDKINADQEATFGLRGALAILPDNVRKLRAGQAALVDMGGGNVKGAYANIDGSDVTFDVGFGTNNSAAAIEKARGTDTFGQAADKWRKAVFVPALRPQLERKQGVTNRNRVYLIGGIVWALVTMTHPEDKRTFFPLDPASIDDLITKASAKDSDLCSDEHKKTVGIAKVCDTFSLNQMVAGLQLLKAISEELNFVAAKKHVFFFRPLYVWPLGYIRTKLYPEK